MSKILERVIHTQLITYLINHDLLSPNQHGFQPSHSTHTAILDITECVRSAVDERMVSVLVSFDFSKAFDTIPHRRLLVRLREIGCDDLTIRWFADYLSLRSLAVRNDDVLKFILHDCSPWTLLVGLGPLLRLPWPGDGAGGRLPHPGLSRFGSALILNKPAVWFAQAETQFALGNITTELTKHYHVISQLDVRAAAEVEDIITNMPANQPYTHLRQQLIVRLSSSEEQRIRQLLHDEELGDRKPSRFLRHLKSLAGWLDAVATESSTSSVAEMTTPARPNCVDNST
ncbi:unnamed protein product [Trichogramma brassicae]|uniref:Uncharacterized protein n=1 Tax=Trichogramma brassicae TaxID=86971 RepID=A0A6H5I6E7_9HYME|nr:unnamed protein product [Trichogramma brassicae]